MIKMEKSVLRKQIIEKRLGFSNTKKLAAKNHILAHLAESEHFLKADFIGIFYPAGGEIDLTELITLYPDKIFGYPKIVNDKIMYLQVDANTKLKKVGFGLHEPQFGFDITSKLELCLVPALGITQNHYRLGYGKGYFDKFFKLHQNIYKIGIIYEGETVDFEPKGYDIPLDDYIAG